MNENLMNFLTNPYVHIAAEILVIFILLHFFVIPLSKEKNKWKERQALLDKDEADRQFMEKLANDRKRG